MGEVRGVLRDAIAVVWNGFRLAGAHWPVLATIFLLGAAGRWGFLWLAVALSENHSTLAGLVIPLAPLSTLVAIIAMLLVVSTSLTSLVADTSAPSPGTAPHTDGWLGVVAGALLPFLTVYAAQGMLKQDVEAYVNEATYDELYGSAAVFYGESANVDRTAIATGWLLVGIVVVALVLRFLFDRFDLPARSRPLAFGAAYVETLWIVTLGVTFTSYQDRAWQWITERRFVHWVQDRWAEAIEVLGPIGDPVATVVGWVGTFIDNADDVVLVPLAWLTVAAVVFGSSIAPPPPRATRLRAPRRLAAVGARTPAVVRRWAGEATSGFRGRFSGLRDGFRVLALGGLVPMVMFCLVFVIADQANALVNELWRLVLGPRDRDTALAFAPWLDITASALEYVVLAGLLAAAIDRILTNQRRWAQETAAAGSDA
ncbi:hypothetical protein H9L21_05785 [Aeromicrobium senzhongii]|uniref:ABC transmembrane type-1 domain-containing protein n=1 Tax=Aeromicrobium senzhongii TaxID=2663859 RepID=A0ABX6SVJ8_9ACTN|nr:hypothetical protein [Aeromicrobium senzhongii]MTB87525.1 hypothetical protein [Aeromicrobium senzhongii]QNL95433.1 hypothetical protein H9L21_05785 [Aeromicrobium senzhongii]